MKISYTTHANPIFGSIGERHVSEYSIKKSLSKLTKIPKNQKFYLFDQEYKHTIVLSYTKGKFYIITCITDNTRPIKYSDGSPVLEVS